MRMFIGILALLTMIVLYVALILLIADQLPDTTHPLILLVFYIIGGLAWTWPAKWIILWIGRTG